MSHMIKRLPYLIILGLLLPYVCKADTSVPDAPVATPVLGGSANSQKATKRIYDMGGRLLIDNSLEVTGIVQPDRYLESIGVSTPTTPTANHARTFLNNTSKQLCTIFDNGTTSCATAISTATLPANIVYTDTNQTISGIKTFTSSVTVPSINITSSGTLIYQKGNSIFYSTGNVLSVGYHALGATYIGSGATANPASDDTAFGEFALSDDIDGVENTGIGNAALFHLTHGTNNTALGSSAGANISTGTFNSCFGVSCMESGGRGNNNTAGGGSSLQLLQDGDNNTALGNVSLFNANKTSNNTGVGFGALFSLTNGSNNTAIGLTAGVGPSSANPLTTGSNNTFLGSGTGTTVPGVTNSCAIGVNAIVTGNNICQIGSIQGGNSEVVLQTSSATIQGLTNTGTLSVSSNTVLSGGTTFYSGAPVVISSMVVTSSAVVTGSFSLPSLSPEMLFVGANGVVLSGAVNLTNQVTGVLPVQNGGANNLVVQETGISSNTTSTSFIETGSSVTIKPSSASSRIKLTFSSTMYVSGSAGGFGAVTFAKNKVNLLGTNGFSLTSETILSATDFTSVAGSYIDSPATTSSVVYSVQIRSSAGTQTTQLGDATVTTTLIAEEIK